ncbi:hypothetical protein [Alkaliphilus hydrothermalis]|uniref:Uncharacterized protein n=1 Tax=Alkaliphilus hydrothermalis TaxID=1482730 RepID=A0ABS2NT51_9FIRM|nr:hypothetical protein [Alkaliphilus hydrothermalis]MBM7616047.1 hypothetical protein [Alkaliphilus hydrothermalis]
MDITGVLTVVAISGITIAGIGTAFYYYKKRNLENFFNQVQEHSKQVPKQKKHSFQLLMFKETLLAAKKKKSDKSSFAAKLQNPKYLEIQLMQMTKILKDPSNVQDKTMKQSLKLHQDYLAWEKAKIADAKKEVEDKAKAS